MSKAFGMNLTASPPVHQPTHPPFLCTFLQKLPHSKILRSSSVVCTLESLMVWRQDKPQTACVHNQVSKTVTTTSVCKKKTRRRTAHVTEGQSRCSGSPNDHRHNTNLVQHRTPTREITSPTMLVGTVQKGRLSFRSENVGDGPTLVIGFSFPPQSKCQIGTAQEARQRDYKAAHAG